MKSILERLLHALVDPITPFTLLISSVSIQLQFNTLSFTLIHCDSPFGCALFALLLQVHVICRRSRPLEVTGRAWAQCSQSL